MFNDRRGKLEQRNLKEGYLWEHFQSGANCRLILTSGFRLGHPYPRNSVLREIQVPQYPVLLHHAVV
jgi:hypothetical protein